MFQFGKKVDKSTVLQGISVPKKTHEALYDFIGFLERGESKGVVVLVDGERYTASMHHLCFSEKYSQREIVNLIWSKPLVTKLKDLFHTSYDYFLHETGKEASPNNYVNVSETLENGVFELTYQLDSCVVCHNDFECKSIEESESLEEKQFHYQDPANKKADGVKGLEKIEEMRLHNQNQLLGGPSIPMSVATKEPEAGNVTAHCEIETSVAKQYYLDRLGNMRRSVKNGVKAPHKLVMLLTVIEQMQEDQFSKYPAFWLCPETENRFHNIWNRFRCDRTPFKPNPHIPFEHLASEGFWNYDKVTRIATLEEELFDHIKADPDAFVRVLVDQLGGMEQYSSSYWYAISNKSKVLSRIQQNMARNFGKMRENNLPFSTQQIMLALEILRTLDKNQ